MLPTLEIVQVELPERRRREVRRHRVSLPPDPGRLPAARRVGDEDAVCQRGQPRGDGNAEVEGRLVARVVVARVPGRRALRLVDDERAVVRRHPALDRVVRVGHDGRRAGVVDRDGEGRSRKNPCPRRHRQLLLAIAREGCGSAVDEQPRDREPAQVEVEARKILRRPGADHGRRRQLVRRRRVVERQTIVLNVVAAVAGVREHRVSEPRRTRREAGRRRRRTKRQGDRACAQCRPCETPCHLLSPSPVVEPAPCAT